MSNIALYEKIDSPTMMDNIKEMGLFFAKSGMLGVKTEAQGQVMAMTCIAENISPVEFARRYHIVEGRLSMKSDAMLARYQELGGRVVWQETTDRICRARWIYNGNDMEISFTIKDAERAGLCGPDGGRKPKQDNDGNWQKYPNAMLRARCTSKAVRMLAPQVNAGVYCPEEIEGMNDALSPAAPLRRGKRREDASEAREVDVRVTGGAAGDAPPPIAPEARIDLSDIEDDANAYLVSISWLSAGQTWRDLAPENVHRVARGMASFRAKAAEHKEASND